MISINKKSFSLILLLIPVSFVFGIVVTELLIALSILFFITFNKDTSIYLDKKTIFLFLLSIYIFLNAKFQIFDNLRLSSFFHFRYVFLSLSIFFLCKFFESLKKKNNILIFFTFFFLIVFIDVIFQFFYGVNSLGFKIINGRVSSFFKEELILGSFLVRVLPIILWTLFFLKINLKKNYLYLTIFFSFYFISIYLSGERTSFFLLIFFIISSLCIIKNFRKILFFSILFFMIFAFSISYFKIGSVDPSSRMFLKTFNQITNQELTPNVNTEKLRLSNKNFNIYSLQHEGHIIIAFKLFNENKIFGAGPKGFRYYCRKVDYDPEIGVCSTHPHNILIQIISELGLIGFTFYIIAGLFVLKNFFISLYNKKFDEDYLAFYSISLGLIINLFPLIPGGNFFNNWISIMLYYNIGLYLYSYKKCTH